MKIKYNKVFVGSFISEKIEFENLSNTCAFY